MNVYACDHTIPTYTLRRRTERKLKSKCANMDATVELNHNRRLTILEANCNIRLRRSRGFLIAPSVGVTLYHWHRKFCYLRSCFKSQVAPNWPLPHIHHWAETVRFAQLASVGVGPNICVKPLYHISSLGWKKLYHVPTSP